MNGHPSPPGGDRTRLTGRLAIYPSAALGILYAECAAMAQNENSVIWMITGALTILSTEFDLTLDFYYAKV
jgi:hypothetical protein